MAQQLGSLDHSLALTRICIAKDGRVKANFNDNSLLLVNRQGSAFTFVPPPPSTEQQPAHSGRYTGASGAGPVRQLSE